MISDERGAVHRGVVRRYDAEEGWGVLDVAGLPGGCWVHFSDIAMDGYRTLTVGQRVTLRAEAVPQDGFSHRAVKVWTGDTEPPDPAGAGGTSTAYRSTLTLTFDQPPDPESGARPPHRR